MTCLRMISLILLLLLIACVSVESTKRYTFGDYRYKALQNLTRARYFAVSNLIKEKQRFMNILFKKYSTMTQEKVFSDTFSTTALAVYDEFESAEAFGRYGLT